MDTNVEIIAQVRAGELGVLNPETLPAATERQRQMNERFERAMRSPYGKLVTQWPAANAPLPLQMVVLSDILPGWLAWLLLAATLGLMLVSGWRAPH